MASDRQGLAVSGSAESVAALDSAVTDYYAWRGDPIATLQSAAETDPSFALGPAAIVSLLALNGTPGDDPRVVAALARGEAAARYGSLRERRHLEAARRWR
jgi:hypothetical protein